MKVIYLFALLALVGFYNQKSLAQNAPTEQQRIERLAGLAKVWGAVKYFHPFLAYRNDIDWDKALVETIPQVNAAKTPQEYNAAINRLLSFLNDRETYAVIRQTNSESPSAAQTDFFRLRDNVLIIDVIPLAEVSEIDQSTMQRLFPQLLPLLAEAKAVVFDCRSTDEVKDSSPVIEYFFDGLLRAVLTRISDKPINLGSTRYRLHNGFAPQTGITSGGYSSSFTQTPSQSVPTQSKTPMLPTVVIFNDKTPTKSQVFTALHSMNNVLTIQEGATAERRRGGAAAGLNLPDGVQVKMRTTENVNADGSVGFTADMAVPKSATVDAPLNEALKNIRENTLTRAKNKGTEPPPVLLDGKDQAYPEMTFPSAEYRLLALFRFWNAIKYFFPYKSLIGDSWQTVLPRYIAKFEANKDAVDYQLTAREMVAEIHDSHGAVRNAAVSNEKLGTFFPPVFVRYVENQTIVNKILGENVPVKVGEVILSVDGEPVEKRREYLSRFIAASTPQALMYNVHTTFLRGRKDSVVKLTVRGADGQTREVELSRTISMTDPKLQGLFARGGDAFRILPDGYGYVDLQLLQNPEVDKMFETIKNTPAVIFDMRGYPNGTAWSIVPRLTEKKNVVGALFSRPFLEATAFSDDDAGGPNFTFEQQLPPPKGNPYKGRIIVLIDESAISQAEHTCLFLESAANVTFIGMPTMGANGDVTTLLLPGNLSVTFTGHNVRHADGRQLQRVGIQPTVKVAPTIRGVVENRDEILEAAVNFLKTGQK